jgi:hypothetical protein
MVFSFKVGFEVRTRAQVRLVEFADPAHRDLVDRDWIDEVELLAASAL